MPSVAGQALGLSSSPRACPFIASLLSQAPRQDTEGRQRGICRQSRQVQKKGEAATPATEQGVATEPKKERKRGKECACIRPFRFCEWGMAARPIGGHENLWNGKMVATKAREAPQTIWTAREAAGVSREPCGRAPGTHLDSLEAPESHVDSPGSSNGRPGRLQQAIWTAWEAQETALR